MPRVTKCALCWNESYFKKNPEELEDCGTHTPQEVLNLFKLCKLHTEQMEANVQKEFPRQNSQYLKTAQFQDCEVPLTFLGWDKKANEDRMKDGKVVSSWKENLKYCLRYSYPEWAKDEAGEPRLDKNGKEFRNSNFDPNYPHGYTIVYHFEEGDLETGSLPLFIAFCSARPSPKEKVLISKTGIDKETKWRVKRASGDFDQRHPVDDVPVIDLEAGGEEVPF